MKRYLLAAAALFALPAAAQAQVTIQGTTTATYHNSDPGLVINATPIDFGPILLDLDGSTATPSFADVNVLTIGTGEGSIELDDLFGYPISVAFAFTNPNGAAGSSISGTTDGTILGAGLACLLDGGCGRADFDSTPTIFNFGDGGSFSVALRDVTFGTPGVATVSGRFTLLSNSVPEPGTWAMMLMGFGAAGMAMRRTRRQQPRLAQLA